MIKHVEGEQVFGVPGLATAAPLSGTLDDNNMMLGSVTAYRPVMTSTQLQQYGAWHRWFHGSLTLIQECLPARSKRIVSVQRLSSVMACFVW